MECKGSATKTSEVMLMMRGRHASPKGAASTNSIEWLRDNDGEHPVAIL